MPDTALVIIARAPELGRVKTRLAAGIGAVGALAVYRQLLRTVAEVQATWPGPVLLAACGAEDSAEESADDAWAGSGLAHLNRRPQASGGLGSRIAGALRWGLTAAPRAIAIGTDCPGLRRPHLDRLAGLLDLVPIAFGPATDGGYWGIGGRDAAAVDLVTDDALPWSTPLILRDSLARLDHAGIAHASADVLADCDAIDDLQAAVAAGLLTWPSTNETLP